MTVAATHRIVFQCDDLSDLEGDQEANQYEEVAYPQIGDVYSKSYPDVIAPRNDVVATFRAVQGARLIGSKTVTMKVFIERKSESGSIRLTDTLSLQVRFWGSRSCRRK